MSNQQYNKNINEPIIGSTRDTSTFPAGSAKPGQNEPVGSSTTPSMHGQSLGSKLDSAIHQAGQTSSSQHTGDFDNIGQKHPIWSSDASKTGSDVREGLGSQSNQPSYTQSSFDKDSTYQGVGHNLGSQKTGDWTDTSSKLGSDQRENLGTYSTTSTYPTSTTATSLSHTYDTSTYPSSTGPSLSQTYGSTSTYGSTGTTPSSSTDTQHKDSSYHVSDSKHDESKTSGQTSSDHKPTVTEKIKEKVHHAAEKVKEAFT